MSGLTETYTLSGATFQNSATLSGTYTVVYNADGTIASVSDVNLTATAAGGATTQITSLTAGAPISASNGTHYILTNSDATTTGPFSGINIVFNGETPAHLSVNNYAGETTNLQTTNSDGSVATSNLITNGGGTITESAVCFYAGTAISTPAGDVAIETLSAGDLVKTSDGEIRAVRWLGRQTISTRFADPLRVLPIRIRAGALGDNLPVRDLLVSPCHALLVDGMLMQAGALVNGISIVRESNVPTTFVYYHVELADHSLMLAEGVPAETFVDNVDRLGFDNWAEHEALAVDGAIVEMDYARAQSARQVPPETHARLLMQAMTMSVIQAAA